MVINFSCTLEHLDAFQNSHFNAMLFIICIITGSTTIKNIMIVALIITVGPQLSSYIMLPVPQSPILIYYVSTITTRISFYMSPTIYHSHSCICRFSFSLSHPET